MGVRVRKVSGAPTQTHFGAVTDNCASVEPRLEEVFSLGHISLSSLPGRKRAKVAVGGRELHCLEA